LSGFNEDNQPSLQGIMLAIFQFPAQIFEIPAELNFIRKILNHIKLLPAGYGSQTVEIAFFVVPVFIQLQFFAGQHIQHDNSAVIPEFPRRASQKGLDSGYGNMRKEIGGENDVESPVNIIQ
jgi:hypothetical protein